MNILKLIIGLALLGIVVSYPLMGSLGLAALGMPFWLVIIVGIALVVAGIKLILDGISEP